MITSIAIENFKAIRERVTFELKPITLLFGPNSAGKSSILHALHYAREVFERRNLDADRTLSGDGVIDLGGFRNFVHGRQPSTAVVLRFDICIDSEEEVRLPVYAVEAFDNPGATDPGLGHLVESLGVEIEVAWSEWRGRPFVRRYEVSVNGQRLATLVADAGQRQVALADLDIDHPIFQLDDGESILSHAVTQYAGDMRALRNVPLQGMNDALPQWGSPLSPILVKDDSWSYNEQTGETCFGYEPPGTGPVISLLSHNTAQTGIR